LGLGFGSQRQHARLLIDFTSDQHRLENSVIGRRADGERALFDAVDFALDHLKQSKNRKKVRGCDRGEDNAGRLRLSELIERVEEEETVIYTVGMFGSMGSLSSLIVGSVIK
jgi:hypothetical protein